jgi:hypothetical protein
MRALISGGALLALCACAAAGEVGRLELSSTLTGHQAVPAPGDMDGTGTARVRVDARAGSVCWELNARGIEPATAAHIHRGEAGSVGPPVVQLTVPVPERSEGCAVIDPALAGEMIARPHAFYVNIHNGPFPQSAIRGQLRSQVTRPEPQRRVPGR